MASEFTGYRRVRRNSYGGIDFVLDNQVELAELPRSRAPSYRSIAKDDAFWDGNDDDDERKQLTGHAALPSGYDVQHTAGLESDHRDSLVSLPSTLRDKRRTLQGWHFGVQACAWTATSVLVMNTIFTIIAVTKFGIDDGVGVALDGDCSRVNSLTTWVHVLINALSSILLSASNYTMQALSAPTRAECDRAHARGDWMDIGVASVRNIFGRVYWVRTVLWWILAVSSIPIHLLFNSAVFKTIDSNEYVVVGANSQWLEGSNFTTTIPWANAPGDSTAHVMAWPYNYDMKQLQKFWVDNYQNPAMVQNLTNVQCIEAYSTNYLSGRNHVLLMTSQTGMTANETMFFALDTLDFHDALPSWWQCAQDSQYSSEYYFLDQPCNTQNLKRNAENWVINGKQIDYCLSQIVPSHCELQFSVQVLIAVIICNALKAGAMFYTLYRQKEPTLVTVGDAIASYLDHPDPLTKGRCLMSRKDVGMWKLQGSEKKPNTAPLPVTWYPTKRARWFQAASVARWVVTYSLVVVALIAVAVLLFLGVQVLKAVGTDPFSLSFGAIDSRTLLDTSLPQTGGAGLVSAILLANCPQAICSFLYLLYNSLLTSLLLAREWSQFAMRKKPLRVTTPHGAQRSTYYLQLPLRYSGPLLVISGVLHWTISQSLFLARVNFYRDGQPETGDDISQVGFSCGPILTAMMLGLILLFFAFGLGLRRFSSTMPVVSSCSVAIAAACHRPESDVDAAYLPVQWGECISEGTEETRHCSFTSGYVLPLTAGRMYA